VIRSETDWNAIALMSLKFEHNGLLTIVIYKSLFYINQIKPIRCLNLHIEYIIRCILKLNAACLIIFCHGPHCLMIIEIEIHKSEVLLELAHKQTLIYMLFFLFWAMFKLLEVYPQYIMSLFQFSNFYKDYFCRFR
jgi:hypothetical protein